MKKVCMNNQVDLSCFSPVNIPIGKLLTI